MSIVKVIEREFTHGNTGVQQRKITFLGIPLYEKKSTTTNSNIVKQLTTIKVEKDKTSKDGALKAKMGFQVSD